MKMLRLFSPAFAAIVLTASTVYAQDGWINLFNGKNLDGWEEHSGKGYTPLRTAC